VAGSLAMLGYWTAVLVLLLLGFATPRGGPGGVVRGGLALLGRRSLLVFVAHAALLVLDSFVWQALELDKGLWLVVAFAVSNVALVLGLAWLVERSAGLRAVVAGLLLGTSRSPLFGGRAVSLPGALAFAAILAVYTSVALARPDASMVVDDFRSESCPSWWTFGFVPQRYVVGESGEAYLEVVGPAPGTSAHGRGLFPDRDVGDRRTLWLRVRGEGPGSGRIKIELMEDDNGNWEIEKLPPLYVPIFDDRWVYELNVDWRGWREVSIPFAHFRDDNPQGGNNVFDPVRDLTSGGLLELQLLFIPTGTFDNDVRLAIDEIRFEP
jgi:hypothetical protein